MVNLAYSKNRLLPTAEELPSSDETPVDNQLPVQPVVSPPILIF